MLPGSNHPPQTSENLRPDETPPDLADLQVPPLEWRAIVDVRANVLVEGPDCSTEKLIRAATSAVGGPVHEWESSFDEQELGATLIVRRVDLLSAAEHRRLLDFLNSEGAQVRVRQVIATSARPMYALVESGLFSADLYYRINTIRLEFGEASSQGIG